MNDTPSSATQGDAAPMELGVMTLSDLVPDPHTGIAVSARQRLHEIVDAARIADAAGLDTFAVGEHHREDFAVSAVPVVLAAIAQVTQRVRLVSSVTILGTSDPVRVFEDFATVDLLSDGRAEIIAGRGAFIESFALFGYDLHAYDELFSENLDLLLQLNRSPRITWQGRFRTPLENAAIAPRPVQPEIPVWVGVGGTPESAARAGRFGLPMTIGIIGGDSARFKPLVELYHRAGTSAGHDTASLKVAVTSYVHINKDSQKARDEFYPYLAQYFATIARDRGRGWQVSRSDFDYLVTLPGAYFVGSPQEIVDKIMYQREMFDHQRFMGQMDIGGQPFDMVAATIELFANDVAPVVRR